MVAFLVQCSSQHKPVPTNQPLSTFGHLHLSKATNSRNNPIPANAVEAKKQVGPPSAITLGYVRTFIRTGIFIGRRSVPQPVYRLQVNRPRLCLLCLRLRAKVQELELISKSEVNQNIESPINYHTICVRKKTHDLGDGYSLWHTHCQVDDFCWKLTEDAISFSSYMKLKAIHLNIL